MDSECVCRTSEKCKSLVLQDKCNIEIFLAPGLSHKHVQGLPEPVVDSDLCLSAD